MTTTPIEKRATWTAHKEAFARAKADGACWDCATRAGFSATDKPPSKPTLCEQCRRKGVGK